LTGMRRNFGIAVVINLAVQIDLQLVNRLCNSNA
jgi:hypothetical protein